MQKRLLAFMQADNNKKIAAEEISSRGRRIKKEKTRRGRKGRKMRGRKEELPRSRRWQMGMVGEVVVGVGEMVVRVGEVRKRG